MNSELKKRLTMDADLYAAFPLRNKFRNNCLKFLFGFGLIILINCFLLNFTLLHAGQTLYYDNRGNLISKEEYEKLIGKNKKQKGSSTAKSEKSEVDNQITGEDNSIKKGSSARYRRG